MKKLVTFLFVVGLASAGNAFDSIEQCQEALFSSLDRQVLLSDDEGQITESDINELVMTIDDYCEGLAEPESEPRSQREQRSAEQKQLGLKVLLLFFRQ